MVAKKTRKPVFRMQFDPNYKGAAGETSDKPSETVPDMSISIRKMLENHTRGTHSDVHVHEANYFETEIPRIDDITDLMLYREDLYERKAKIEEEIKAANKAREELKNKQKVETPEQPEKPPQKPSKEE